MPHGIPLGGDEKGVGHPGHETGVAQRVRQPEAGEKGNKTPAPAPTVKLSGPTWVCRIDHYNYPPDQGCCGCRIGSLAPCGPATGTRLRNS